MSETTRDEEIAALKTENAHLQTVLARLRAEQESQGPVTVRVLPPESHAILPSDAQMHELLTVVQKHWPKDFVDVAPDEFGRAFEVLATFHRQDELDTTVYAYHWTGIANARLQMRNQREISLLAFTAAALAWSDIPLTRWDLLNEGFLQEFGLSEFHGRLPESEWQRTLRREFCTPIDKRPKRRMSDNAPRPSILSDGKPLPSYAHYQGPNYTDF